LRRKAEQELYRAQAKLRQMATQDPLTGIANRKSLFDQLEDVFTRSREMGHDFSLLFVDIDHFKRINDSFGHKAGDQALQQTVAILQNNMRPGDIFGRYGGEELIVGLLDCDLEDARRSAERIRKAVEHASIDLDHEREPLKITVSIGMVTATADIPDIDALVHSADQAAYAAKKAGRNRVHAYDA
jgi:diguanylate cyclase (GGDEF)-like protein